MIETDIIQGDIRYRDSDHSYFWGTKKLTSVSDVIRTVFSTKSWDGVDPAVVENARIRGSKIDRYMAEYVREGRVTIDGESSDVVERLVIAHRIWEQEFHGLKAEAQKIVYSLEDMIAGTLDFFVDGRILVDLKCTYNLEASYILQLGAYASMSPVPVERAGIIHVSPKVYDAGGAWVEYNMAACMHYWDQAKKWWLASRDMAKTAKVSR